MAELTPDQVTLLATLEIRGRQLLALYDTIGRTETPLTSSGRVYHPHWLQLARDQARLSILSARRAIEEPETPASAPPVEVSE